MTDTLLQISGLVNDITETFVTRLPINYYQVKTKDSDKIKVKHSEIIQGFNQIISQELWN